LESKKKQERLAVILATFYNTVGRCKQSGTSSCVRCRIILYSV